MDVLLLHNMEGDTGKSVTRKAENEKLKFTRAALTGCLPRRVFMGMDDAEKFRCLLAGHTSKNLYTYYADTVKSL